MTVLKNIKVPTGNILVVQGMNGKLECLSIGDYGKDKNIKADFMGLSRELNGVEHCDIMPLENKWVITISSQYGCSMGCVFCDVPKVGRGRNATCMDMVNQVKLGISLHPEVTKTARLNVHFARMGEPLMNYDVLNAAYYMAGMLKEKGWGFHPVVSTIIPRHREAENVQFLRNWIELKNCLDGEAGLQLSINTTDNHKRYEIMPQAERLDIVAYMMRLVLQIKELRGRKIALNFALTDAEIDAVKLRSLFDPLYFMCKITPMHMTRACISNKLITVDGYERYYPYKHVEEALKSVGFDVIVFIPSKEEDESRITCGNAILADE